MSSREELRYHMRNKGFNIVNTSFNDVGYVNNKTGDCFEFSFDAGGRLRTAVMNGTQLTGPRKMERIRKFLSVRFERMS